MAVCSSIFSLKYIETPLFTSNLAEQTLTKYHMNLIAIGPRIKNSRRSRRKAQRS